jgi:hypothetical protein
MLAVLFVQEFFSSIITQLNILNCQTSQNKSILSLIIPLPVHNIDLTVTLTGIKTIGGIRVSLNGSSVISDDFRYTLMEVNFASTFVPNSLDEVLSPSTFFTLTLTPIINRTDPLNSNDFPTYSGIWSSSFNVNKDELFSEETRYTLYQRTYTNVTISIVESLFYVSNQEKPIARQSEIIFRNLLFTIVLLELFGLLFLLNKLLIIPLFNIIYQYLQRFSKKNQVHIINNNINTKIDSI